MFEGVGAPVNVAQKDDGYIIDPTLDSCCQREVRPSRNPDYMACCEIGDDESTRGDLPISVFLHFATVHGLTSNVTSSLLIFII